MFGDPPEHAGGIADARNHGPAFVPRWPQFGAIAFGKVKAAYVIPPQGQIRNAQVYHGIVRPFLDIIILQQKRTRTQAHLDELTVDKRYRPEAKLAIKACTGFEILG